MKEIQKLIQINKQRGQRSIQLVNQNFRKKEKSKDNVLYEDLCEDRYTTEEEASQALFNDSPQNRNYRNAKGKLKRKLLNNLYFLDYDKDYYTLNDKTYFESLHSLHQCKILVKEEANDIALRMLPHLVKVAEEYEFTDIAIESLTLMRNIYAIIGKRTAFEETNEELKALEAFAEAVSVCEEKYYGCITQFNKSLNAQHQALDHVPEVVDYITKCAEQFNSIRLRVLVKKLIVLSNHLCGKYQENIALISRIEESYLSDSEGIRVDLDQKELAHYKLYAYYVLRDSIEGPKYANKALKLFKEGYEDWFLFIEYYFLLVLSIEDYDSAAKIYRKVRTNKNYNNLIDEVKDRWHIYRSYLIYLNESKLLRWGFDLESYLREIPNYSKNMQGYNTATLISQFLFLLREGDEQQLHICIDNLQPFASDHLDKRHNYRNSLFIRMLAAVVDKSFNYQEVRERTASYLQKLQKTKIPSDLHLDLEVVPYENLWREVLNILKTNKLYVHYKFYHSEV